MNRQTGDILASPHPSAPAAPRFLYALALNDEEPATGKTTARLPRSKSPISNGAAFSFQNDDARGPYLIDRVEAVWLTVKSPKP